MNISLNKALIILLNLIFLLFLIYVLKPSEQDRQKANSIIQDISTSDINKLSIVIHNRDGYSYLIIKNKIIINEFINALKNDSWIPENSAGHHAYIFYITLHSNSKSFLMELNSDSTDINSNFVDITLIDVNNIDIYDMYYLSTTKREEFSSLFYGMFYGMNRYEKYNVRNERLHDVLNKYFKEKGLKYNSYSKKWSKN